MTTRGSAGAGAEPQAGERQLAVAQTALGAPCSESTRHPRLARAATFLRPLAAVHAAVDEAANDGISIAEHNPISRAIECLDFKGTVQSDRRRRLRQLNFGRPQSLSG